MTAITDYNTKSKNWYSHDKTSFKGKTIENVTYNLGYISYFMNLLIYWKILFRT